mmetsp:Transcript_22619/g.62951  ORF Transcript_22619/g.62951 Transcript_22619/m.62951 type:complete len:341 (-) Transcript_22619:74-1096(-)
MDRIWRRQYHSSVPESRRRVTIGKDHCMWDGSQLGLFIAGGCTIDVLADTISQHDDQIIDGGIKVYLDGGSVLQTNQKLIGDRPILALTRRKEQHHSLVCVPINSRCLLCSRLGGGVRLRNGVVGMKVFQVFTLVDDAFDGKEPIAIVVVGDIVGRYSTGERPESSRNRFRCSLDGFPKFPTRNSEVPASIVAAAIADSVWVALGCHKHSFRLSIQRVGCERATAMTTVVVLVFGLQRKIGRPDSIVVAVGFGERQLWIVETIFEISQHGSLVQIRNVGDREQTNLAEGFPKHIVAVVVVVVGRRVFHLVHEIQERCEISIPCRCVERSDWQIEVEFRFE